MPEFEVREARGRWRDHPFLGPATATLVNLMDMVNANSDGWAYWNPPLRAANKLIELIEGDTHDALWYRSSDHREDVTLAKLKAAYVPLKAFRTKISKPPLPYGMRRPLTFDIVEVDAEGAPLIFQNA